MIYFSSLLMILLTSDWQIEKTGVFQPLTRDQVKRSPEGDIFVLNFEDACILHYDSQGKPVGKIGRKGQGPGEFTIPSSFFYSSGTLFVTDEMVNQVILFQPDGTFLKKIPLPARGLTILKVMEGWVYINWERENQGKGGQVFWADETFENPQLLLEFDKRGVQSGLTLTGLGKAVFSPINSLPQMVSNWNGTKVFISDPEKFKISVFDVVQKVMVQPITRSDKAVPFDEEWGKDRLRTTRENMPPGISNLKPLFPDRFPVIRDMLIDPKGNLVVSRWRGMPDGNRHTIAFDENGRQVESLSWQALSRVTAVWGEKALVSVLEPSSREAGLARIDLCEVEAFVKKNPIDQGGSSGKSILILD